jgi:hypothetical protein
MTYVTVTIGGPRPHLLGDGYRGIALNDCVTSAHPVANAILTPAGSNDARVPA